MIDISKYHLLAQGFDAREEYSFIKTFLTRERLITPGRGVEFSRNKTP